MGDARPGARANRLRARHAWSAIHHGPKNGRTARAWRTLTGERDALQAFVSTLRRGPIARHSRCSGQIMSSLAGCSCRSGATGAGTGPMRASTHSPTCARFPASSARNWRCSRCCRTSCVAGVAPRTLPPAVDRGCSTQPICPRFAILVGPMVSVVVPTRNRRALVERLLAALEAQTYQQLEIVVVDDGSTDGTADVSVTVKRQTGASRSVPGLVCGPEPRLAIIQGEIVAFTDDDCVPQPGWIAALVDALQEPNVVAAQGVTLPVPGEITPFTHQIQQTQSGPPYRTCNIAYRRRPWRPWKGLTSVFTGTPITSWAISARTRADRVRSGRSRVPSPSTAFVAQPGGLAGALSDRCGPSPRVAAPRGRTADRSRSGAAHRSLGSPAAGEATRRASGLRGTPSPRLHPGHCPDEQGEDRAAACHASVLAGAPEPEIPEGLSPLPADPCVSVVVVTTGRLTILDTLAALRQQSFHHVSASWWSMGGRPLQFPDNDVRAISVPADWTLGMVRQAGVDAATGDIVAFTDDDCIPNQKLAGRGRARLQGCAGSGEFRAGQKRNTVRQRHTQSRCMGQIRSSAPATSPTGEMRSRSWADLTPGFGAGSRTRLWERASRLTDESSTCRKCAYCTERCRGAHGCRGLADPSRGRTSTPATLSRRFIAPSAVRSFWPVVMGRWVMGSAVKQGLRALPSAPGDLAASPFLDQLFRERRAFLQVIVLPLLPHPRKGMLSAAAPYTRAMEGGKEEQHRVSVAIHYHEPERRTCLDDLSREHVLAAGFSAAIGSGTCPLRQHSRVHRPSTTWR